MTAEVRLSLPYKLKMLMMLIMVMVPGMVTDIDFVLSPYQSLIRNHCNHPI